MSLTINKAAYTKLIAEDIEWLMEQPRSLERDHIKMVLEQSIDEFYRPDKAATPDNA